MPLILREGRGEEKKKSHAPQLSLHKVQSQMCHSTLEELNRLAELAEHTVHWQLFQWTLQYFVDTASRLPFFSLSKNINENVNLM